MQKRVFWYAGAGLFIVIAGSIFWIFHEPLQDWFKGAGEHSILIEKKSGVTRKPSYAGRLTEARRLMDHGYFSLATIELQGAIREKPKQIAPYELLGEIYVRTRDLGKLDNLIAELEKSFPKNPEIQVLQGRKLIAENKFAEALKQLNATENLPPALEFYRAALLALQNNHTTAKEILESLISLPLQSESEESSEQSRTLSPQLFEKIQNFLKVYTEFGEFSEGKSPHLFALIGKMLAEKEESALAHEFADTAIREDISYIDAWIVRGYAALQMEDIESALEDLRHAYELDPLRPQSHYFLALALDRAGKTDEAILFFEKSLEHEFEFSEEVKWKLVELFSRSERYDRVLELYRDLLEPEDNPDEYVRALHTAIDLVKKPEVALEFAEKLIEKNPNDVFAMNMYGWALVANKRFIPAEEMLRRAEKRDPENPRTFLNLGLLYQEQANFLAAKEMYKKSYDLGKSLDTSAGVAITNLAAERYNHLLAQIERPEEPAAPDKPESSP